VSGTAESMISSFRHLLSLTFKLCLTPSHRLLSLPQERFLAAFAAMVLVVTVCPVWGSSGSGSAQFGFQSVLLRRWLLQLMTTFAVVWSWGIALQLKQRQRCW